MAMYHWNATENSASWCAPSVIAASMDRQIQWTGAPIEVVSTDGSACLKASRSSWRPVRHGPR